ncbi:MAG: FCD domain-containing protein [Opitutaceae bacterium]|nr:FCD domain-containing protein [Opitutaceae bacterium]
MPAVTSLRRPPLVREIANRLVSDHRSSDWLPPERKLAGDLGVSRAALREAIKQLEMQGLLEVKHGIGVRVTHRPDRAVGTVLRRELPRGTAGATQLAEVRLLVEPFIARKAALAASPREIRRLTEIHGRFSTATSPREAVAIDLEFHRALASLARNSILSLMLHSIGDIEEETRQLTLSGVGLPTAIKQHQQILAAIAQNNPEAAETAMSAHVQAAAAAAKASRTRIPSS